MISRTIVLLAAATLCYPAASAAQQRTTFQITVPFTVSKLHPEILSVKAVCRLGTLKNSRLDWEMLPPAEEREIMGEAQPRKHEDDPNRGWHSGEVALRDLSVKPNGEYSGELRVLAVADIPNNTTGKSGGYECGLQGCVEAVSGFGVRQVGPTDRCNYFRTAPGQDTDPRMLITVPAGSGTSSGKAGSKSAQAAATSTTTDLGTRPLVKGSVTF